MIRTLDTRTFLHKEHVTWTRLFKMFGIPNLRIVSSMSRSERMPLRSIKQTHVQLSHDSGFSKEQKTASSSDMAGFIS